jgi:hypothetical protein
MSALELKREQYGDNTILQVTTGSGKVRAAYGSAISKGCFRKRRCLRDTDKRTALLPELAFVEQIKELVPSESYLKMLRKFIAFFNRNLEDNITERIQE